MKKLEAVTNVVTIVVAILAAYVLIRNHMPRPLPPQVKVGEQLTIAGVNWAEHPRTLVLALHTGCRYCAESAPFYAQAAGKLRAAGVHTLAVLPQSVAESADYLKRLGVAIEDVRQAVFGELKVRATPTLILVDRSGTVLNVWVGRLGPDKEQEVLETAATMSRLVPAVTEARGTMLPHVASHARR